MGLLTLMDGNSFRRRFHYSYLNNSKITNKIFINIYTVIELEKIKDRKMY